MIFKDLIHLESTGVSFILVTITHIRGSAPQDLGAKCIITKEGLYSGTIGGGKIEAHVIQYAQEQLHGTQNKVKTETWNLQKDIGMTCGGEVSFLFEKFSFNHWPIIIFGAGHVSQQLSRVLSRLNCQLTVIDPRREWIDKLPPEINTICIEDTDQIIKDANPNTFFISMTKGHASDVPKLESIAKYHPECPYVGVIGSEVKGKSIKNELKEKGISESFLDKLRIPIGLDIGSNDPSEIAISIASELLQVRDQK